MSFKRLADSANQAAGVERVAACDAGNLVATAVKILDGRLKLISWKVQNDGKISRLHDAVIQDFPTQIAVYGGAQVLTAHRGKDDGRLYLTTWKVDPTTGAVTVTEHWGSGSPAPVIDDSRIAITSAPNNRWLVAFRDSDGHLRLQTWGIKPQIGLHLYGDSKQAAGPATNASVAWSGNHLITAVRDGSGRLKLISWTVASDGTIDRVADSGNQAGGVTAIAAAQHNGHVVTAVRRNDDGNLRLINWQVGGTGAINRVGDSGTQAGAVSEVAEDILVDETIVTAVRDSSGSLKLINWDVADNGSLKRLGDSAHEAGAASHVNVLGSINNSIVVTPVRAEGDAGGRLRLISWKKT